ncbi:MAG: inositol monophosphatase [Saccharospirillaceae bacterium]|nr:hypothetical protein [Pseudomonadales bacterium]NRB78836.1 inositol monophosphatase [Saccharospirillaceae bacterium]
MKLTAIQLKQLSEVAKEAAKQAGDIIQTACVEELNVENKNGATSLASSVFTKIDLQCQELIFNLLSPSIKQYDLGWLGEESPDDGSRFKQDYFWCVDPLDGTLSFIKQRAGFSVSIALINKQGIPVIGVVFNPQTSDLYCAVYKQGAFKNEKAIKVKYQKHITLINDESFLNTQYYPELKAQLEFKNQQCVQQILQGGAIMNAIWCLEYAPAVYIKYPKKTDGGGCIWDYASTVCIYNELELNATDFHLNELNLNPSGTAYMNTEGVLISTLLTKMDFS